MELYLNISISLLHDQIDDLPSRHRNSSMNICHIFEHVKRKRIDEANLVINLINNFRLSLFSFSSTARPHKCHRWLLTIEYK